MPKKPNKRINPKIIISYLVLGLLALVAGYFISTEIQNYLAQETVTSKDNKLLRTSALFTKLYEAESLSKVALQTKSKATIEAYALKIDSIKNDIDTLKTLTKATAQHFKLDSVQLLLTQKVINNNALITLSRPNNTEQTIASALKEFDKIEESYGKFSAENLYPNFETFSPNVQQSLREYAALISKNSPIKNSANNAAYIDSILSESKKLLTKALKNNTRTQISLAQKEREITKNDQELSQQLRNIISAYEQEILVNTIIDSKNKQADLQRSMRWAGMAAILAFIIVGLFSFLINRDFWKIQTYQNQLEKEKKYSESLLKSKEQLLATVSHDLRTPLNTINGYTDLLEGTQLSSKQNEYITHVKSASEYVENLVNDLLDYSKLEAGKLKIENVPFVASTLITDTSKQIQSLFAHKNIQLHFELDDALTQTFLGDPFRIKQILTNLVGNAFKFTEKGSITIKAKIKPVKGKKVALRIDVIDSGIGIPKEKQQHIFKEFSQAESSTEKKYGGYGLGLTISKKLAALLNGTIWVESKVSKGSTFSLSIPLQKSNRTIDVAPMPNAALPKLKMLIIDDDTALLRMLKELTESIGIKTHTYANFSTINTNTDLEYDVVLTDIQMPNISGFEVLEQLRSGNFKHYSNQPILAMTGRRDLEEEVYTKHGFKKVLKKPFSKKDLLTVLNEIGFTTAIVKNNDEVKTVETTKGYSINLIQSFLGENKSALNDVMHTFLTETKQNMEVLSGENIDFSISNAVAHKMLPMFRQLKIDNAVVILEKLETATPENITKDALSKYIKVLNFTVAKVTTEISNDYNE